MSEEDIAIPFIVFQPGTQKYEVTEDARQFLSTLEMSRIGVISIVGKYRTGKSYFINKILLNRSKQKGFAVGPTINPCTKGLWLWKRVMNAKDFGGEDLPVLIVDTEGFGGVDENANHDSRIFLFSVLLSSQFIYNSVNAIDEGSLQTLSLVLNLAKDVKVGGGDQAVAENFPQFLWVLRDFSLDLVDGHGVSQTPKQYLESALSLQKGISETVEAKNRIRRNLKHFFPVRDCITFVRPLENESDLQRLDSLDDSLLRPEFVEQIRRARDKIYRGLSPKLISGQCVSPPGLLAAANAYIQAVNSGQVLAVDAAWTGVCAEQNATAARSALMKVETEIRALRSANRLPTPETRATLLRQALVDFKRKALGAEDEQKSERDKLEKAISQKFDALEKDMQFQAEKDAQKSSDELFAKLRARILSGELHDSEELRISIDTFERENPRSPGDLAWTTARTTTELQLLRLLLDVTTSARRTAMVEAEEARALAKRNEVAIAEATRKGEEASTAETALKKKVGELEAALAEQSEKLATTARDSARAQTALIEEAELNQRRMRDEIGRLSAALAAKSAEADAAREESRRRGEEEARLVREVGVFREEKFRLEDRMRQLELADPREKEAVAELRAKLEAAESERLELRINKQFLQDQIEFHKNHTEEVKRLYKDVLLVQGQGLSSDNAQADLLAMNKMLSQSLAKSQSTQKVLQEQNEILKKFRKICKLANGVQCFRCFRSFNVSVFLDHVEACAGPTGQPDSPTRVNFRSTSLPKLGPVPLSFRIEKAAVSFEANREFVEYAIVVSSGSRVWNIRKRYKDFSDLKKKLQTDLPDLVFPPSARAFVYNIAQIMNQVKSDPEERKRALETFLNDLGSMPQVLESKCFQDFVEEPPERGPSLRNFDEMADPEPLKLELDDQKLKPKDKLPLKPKDKQKNDFVSNAEMYRKLFSH